MSLPTPIEIPTNAACRDEAADWLLGRINYERTAGVPYGERQLKLDRMRQFVTALGSPDRAAPIVHVAGTKGKGSTAAMIAAMLTAAGVRTGVYSSPHIERLEERFAIDGRPCTGEQLAAVVACVRPVVEEFDRRTLEVGDRDLTFFDIATGVALVHFAHQRCGAVVLEVGLGGRLDSTNVCLPAVSVITSISFDHTQQLGNTLASIAREKAGIIKPGVPVVSGVVGDEPRGVIAELAREHGCRLIEIGRDFAYICREDRRFDFLSDGLVQLAAVELGLAGRHQAANAAVALAVIEELTRHGWHVDPQKRRLALAETRLPGRFETLPGTPAVVIDTAHNEASAEALAATLAETFAPPRTLVAACSKDKDVAAIARGLAPAFDRIVVTQYQENPRAVPVDTLAEVFREAAAQFLPPQRVDVLQAATPREAWQVAQNCTPSSGVIAIAGSFYLAAELRPVVLGDN